MNADAVVKDALSPLGVPAHREVPPAVRADEDFLVYREQSGASPWPGQHERLTYVVEAWVGSGDPATRLTRVKTLGNAARQALFDAWRNGRRTEHGAINHVSNVPRVTLQPSGIDGLYRAVTTVDLSIRP